MKELKYKKDFGKQIANINRQDKLVGSAIHKLVALGLIGMGVLATMYLGSVALSIYLIMNLLGVSYIVIRLICAVIKGTNSSRSLDGVVSELKTYGVDIDRETLEETVTVENNMEVSTIYDFNDESYSKEVIKRFYMLDKKNQIKVLQETIKTYEDKDEVRNFSLLEENDLKAIEMPEFVLSLKYKEKTEKNS